VDPRKRDQDTGAGERRARRAGDVEQAVQHEVGHAEPPALHGSGAVDTFEGLGSDLDFRIGANLAPMRESRSDPKPFMRILLPAVPLLFSILAVAPVTIPFKTIDRGQQSNIDEAREVVIRTAADWTKLWRQHAGDRPSPDVDLTKSIVIGVFLGSRPT